MTKWKTCKYFMETDRGAGKYRCGWILDKEVVKAKEKDLPPVYYIEGDIFLKHKAIAKFDCTSCECYIEKDGE